MNTAYVVCVVVSLVFPPDTTSAEQAGRGPAFEAASIKVAAQPEAPDELGGPGTESPTEWRGSGLRLDHLILEAWDLPIVRLSTTSSLQNARYDIVARVPPQTSTADFRLMMRGLLTKQLALEAHFEPRQLNVLELTVAKSGLKMGQAEAPPHGAPAPVFMGPADVQGVPQLPAGYPNARQFANASRVFFLGRVQSIADLIRVIETPLGQVVVDRTGLTAKYDYSLSCFRAEMNSDLGSGPLGCFMAVMKEQLGLEFHPAKSSVNILVIDRFNKVPSGN